MGICMVWGIRVWVYCATGANALVVYDDDGGVHEISAQVFDDIHILDNLYTGQFDSSFDILDHDTITLVPEPASLRLLLMGTLFVRRKRNGGCMPQ